MPTEITGLDAIWVHITDIAKARVFYRDVLGLPELGASDKGMWAMYEIPGGPILGVHRRFPREPGRPAGTVTGAFLRVDDVEEAVRRTEARGGTITDRPLQQSWGDVHATVADPDGNEFVLSTRTKPFRPCG
jgi:predicted enzyme related to lactoylglutathione lyase